MVGLGGRIAVPDEKDSGFKRERYVRSSTRSANSQSHNVPHLGARSRGVGFPIGFSGRLDCVYGGLPQVLDLLAQNLDLPLDKLGLHPDEFIDILGLNDLLGEVERGEHVTLGKFHRLLADALRTDLARLDPLIEGRNRFLRRLTVIGNACFACSTLRSAMARISLGISSYRIMTVFYRGLH